MRNEINNHMHSATETTLPNDTSQYNTQYIDGFFVNNTHASSKNVLTSHVGVIGIISSVTCIAVNFSYTLIRCCCHYEDISI